jgi:hypothetical protein
MESGYDRMEREGSFCRLWQIDRCEDDDEIETSRSNDSFTVVDVFASKQSSKFGTTFDDKQQA